MAGDQQQGVVDADAEADHGGHGGRGGADVGRSGQDGQPGRADAETDEGGADREARADDGPEGQDQDQQRCEHADQLAAAGHRGGGGVGQVASELDLDAGVAGRLHGLLERLEVAHQVGVGDRHVVGDGEQRGVAVGGHPGFGDGGDVVHRREVGPERGDDGGSERLVVVGDDDRRCVAGARHVLPEQVDAGLGLRALDVPVVVRLAAGDGGEPEEEDGGEQPEAERAPRVQRGAAAEAVERARHCRSFVGGRDQVSAGLCGRPLGPHLGPTWKVRDDASMHPALADASATPYWLDTHRPSSAPAAPRRPPASPTCAWSAAGTPGSGPPCWPRIATPNRDVVLLEGNRIGWAASGRNGGFCAASLTHGHANGHERWPEEMETLDRLGRDNLDAIEETIARYGIRCDFERPGAITVATEPHQVAWLREMADAVPGSRFLDQAADPRRGRLTDLPRRRPRAARRGPAPSGTPGVGAGRGGRAARRPHPRGELR